MEETLGKRISANRKRLGLTQDQLAERLGVTAQAVSKWENDQSCPDIGTLPKLAEIFDITTDELLGSAPREKKKVLEAEVVEPEDPHTGGVEIHVNGGKRGLLGFAIWLLLAGLLLLINPYGPWMAMDTWTVLWTSGLLVFGLFGLVHRFSVFRLGCAILGGLSLASQMFLPKLQLTWPVFLMVLGGLLLIDALLGKREKTITVPVAGHVNTKSSCDKGENSFTCSASFGEKKYVIDCPRLSRGRAELAFGELTLDLSRCGQIQDGCCLDLKASFGEMKVLVPQSCRVQPNVRTSFGDCSVRGEPGAHAESTLYIDGSVSFGEMEIRYI